LTSRNFRENSFPRIVSKKKDLAIYIWMRGKENPCSLGLYPTYLNSIRTQIYGKIRMMKSRYLLRPFDLHYIANRTYAFNCRTRETDVIIVIRESRVPTFPARSATKSERFQTRPMHWSSYLYYRHTTYHLSINMLQLVI